MTNDPEIRAAVLELYGAHVEVLRAAAGLAHALPAEMVADDPYMRLDYALDAELLCMRALAAHIEPPNVMAEIYRTMVDAIEGKR